MNIRKRVLVAVLSLAMVGPATVSIILACMGSPRPNCSQTAWVAKMVPGVVVVPAGAAVVPVPINLLPFVQWSLPTPPCAAPVAATLTVTVTCPGLAPQGIPIAPPVGGPVPVPVAQGLQPAIPAVLPVTVPPVLPAVCTVTAEYRVTFAGGIGAGVVIGRGDAEVCLVDPSPLDPDLPRLDMQLVTPGDDLFQRCQRGDETFNWYVLANNDPDDSVELTVTASSEQIARIPGGTAPNVFSLSSPVDGTDRFAVSFGEDPLPTGDPTDPNDPVNQPAMTTVTIPPLKVAILKVNTGINGMCANGSCGEMLTKAVGQWNLAGGGSEPALACAQTVIVVDNTADAKKPLCEICDEAKSGPECFWETAFFDDPGDHQSTLPGRDDPSIPLDEFLSPGQNPPILAAQPRDFTQPISDIIRLVISPQFARYQVLCQFPGQTLNQVQINGFANLPPDLPLQIPLIRDVGGNDRQLVIDVIVPPIGPIGAMVFENKNPIFDGPLEQLRQNGVPQANLQADNFTCRTFTKKLPPPPEDPGGPVICADPSEVVWLGRGSRELDVFDARSDNPISWSAATDDPRISPSAAAGAAGDPIGLEFTNIPEAPGLALAKVVVSNPATFNGRKTVLVAARTLPGPPFRITKVAYNSGTGMLDITVTGLWTGCDYLLHSSTDLATFTPVAASAFTATSETQTVMLPVNLLADPDFFVRVAESP